MTVPRYLPAIRTKVRSLRLGRVERAHARTTASWASWWGFVIDPQDRHVRSLVMDVVDAAGSQQVELPMVPICFDADSHALRMIGPDVPSMSNFRPESASPIDEDELWIPIIHTAA